jgi:hypothetical protein
MYHIRSIVSIVAIISTYSHSASNRPGDFTDHRQNCLLVKKKRAAKVQVAVDPMG